MADYYVDSSALAKRYIAETGSAWVVSLFDPAHQIFIAAITPVEIAAAIARRVRGGTLTLADSQTARHFLRIDINSTYEVVVLTEAVVDRAMELTDIHGLRGYDAVQLASSLEVNLLLQQNGLPPITFVSADIDLNNAAIQEGLSVENPNDHP